MARASTQGRRHILFAPSFYHPQLHKGIARFAAEYGWHLNAKMAVEGETSRGWKGDGAIVQGPIMPLYRDFVQLLDVPMVSMGEFDWGCPLVKDDHDTIGRVAAEHFIGRGFRSFATYTESPSEFPPELQGFKRRLKVAGYGCEVVKTLASTRDWRIQGKYLADQLRALPKPLAVFCRRDHAGVDIIDACLEYGLDVPTEVAVLGKHNNELICNALSVPLSSVDNNLELMGYMAAELLERVLNGESVPAETLVPVKGVVTRASTDILATEHPGVCRALLFIHANFKRPISLVDVARESGMSVRGLQHAFRKEIDRTVNDEIIRLRMQLAEELLLTTDMTVETVGLDAGFHSVRNFHRLFKGATGVTPKRFRLTGR